ncbi:hypothetical protein J7355_16110 [Endozoicomonas sp. G2_2]|uniref:hypothetical protein n=1 Tax=Endozoicomonas sp. G2_2 TaxID=2821092 RepID=UPI001AD9FC40|nr:hypothetical protein [Endozoicomonas sp. G2_2]MBO9471614.1 hypothetical protein [Endozoicomonas sp. G2_2]
MSKTIGRSQIQVDRRGPEWVRNNRAMSRGRYAQHAANLLERVESDGYWSNSHPSDLAGNPLPRVVTVKLIDTVSGAQFGIGFSLGGEAAAAYAAACFCAAIGLRRYLELFGLDVGVFEVPSPGLMTTLITDRGPGSGAALAEQVPFRELSPAYSGQSKSIVESSHPRGDQNAEAPSHPVSRLSPVGLARQELWRAVQHNHRSDASARLTPEMAAANVRANPMAIWTYLEERGRKAGRSMTFEHAVRTFLQPVIFGIDRNGIKLNHLRFILAEGDDDVLSSQAGAGSIEGYCLPMCLRHAWINLEGRLYQVEAQLPFCDDSDQLRLSLTELQAHGRRISAAKAAQAENKRAARLHGDIEFEKQLGAEFDRTQRRPGRAKVRRSVKHEPLR